MQPTEMASRIAERPYVSPGGWRQKVESAYSAPAAQTNASGLRGRRTEGEAFR